MCCAEKNIFSFLVQLEFKKNFYNSESVQVPSILKTNPHYRKTEK